MLPRSKAGRTGVVLCSFIVVVLVAGYFAIRWHVRANAAETIQLAERCLQRKETAAARETLKWLLWFDPGQHRAWLLTGASWNADEKYPQAIEALERIPTSSESFPQCIPAFAASLILDGQLERAEAVLKRELERNPHVADTHNRLLRLYLRQLRKRDATNLLLERWRRFPNDLEVLPDLLELEVGSVTPHDRIAFLETADARHPHQLQVVLAIARAHALMGKTVEAKKRFQEAIALAPNDPVARILAAEFSLDAGDIGLSESLLEVDPAAQAGPGFFADSSDDRYWFLRCRLSDLAGDAQQAHVQLQHAMKLRPNVEAYILMQSALLRKLGRSAEAVEAARRATQLAEDRKHLMILSNKFDRNRPDAKQCLAIAELLDSMGHTAQAADWRRVSKAVTAFESASVFLAPRRVDCDTRENQPS